MNDTPSTSVNDYIGPEEFLKVGNRCSVCLLLIAQSWAGERTYGAPNQTVTIFSVAVDVRRRSLESTNDLASGAATVEPVVFEENGRISRSRS
ncbi:hypothetical protein GX51_03288 [Blastomyces parvus]|uniref:Uncharacterized protein n=1 Tax=Blastomyces parvus TaxID=2060905 RepID=A0A2B7X7U0_9EURO|nr:hypothetical protein GX51_03288 [Blastomyces parvus]